MPRLIAAGLLFVVTAVAATLAGASGLGAQSTAGTHRIAWLAPAANTENLDALRRGLRALGYAEGDNLVVEQRYAEGTPDGLAGAAAQLVRGRPDVIVTDGSAAAVALKRTATPIPVVFVSGDPVEMGLVASLARPGGTLTGVAIVSTQLNVKRLELVREAFPRATRIGVLYEARQLERMVPPIEAGARSLGLQLARLQVRTSDDVDAAFATAVRDRVAVLVPLASALFHAQKHRLVSLAARHRLPTVYENRGFPDAGGLMSYGPDIGDAFHRAATYVDRILRGTRPAELPVEQPTKFELVINVKTAKALSLTIPPSLRVRADHLID